jgi:hypothetical protein
MSPMSKICGHCAACGKAFRPGETAMFFGTIRVQKDRPEPGSIVCAYRTGMVCRASHLQGGERCAICEECWANIKLGYFRSDITHMETT